jgi:hypothetical protein
MITHHNANPRAPLSFEGRRALWATVVIAAAAALIIRLVIVADSMPPGPFLGPPTGFWEMLRLLFGFS